MADRYRLVQRKRWGVARHLGIVMMVVALATGAFAQAQTGNIFGSVVDNDGAAMPGVTVTLSGIGAAKVFVTDSDGKFRFLNLSPGSYTLSAELSGLGSVMRPGVQVNIGRNTDVELELSPSVAETITVTAETPLLDVRQTGTGSTVTELELELVPTARDPWVIVGQTPGVQLDRINVGGSESGQQSVFIGKGTTSGLNDFNVDGVQITDEGATGSSPTYYDFGAFEEMQITTGSSDPRISSPGVTLNVVTKRGTNDWSGEGRFLITDNALQTDPEIPSEAVDYLDGVNEIELIEDWGGNIGGPIVRDRVWFWGAYGRNEIDILAAGLVSDFTLLENFNAKLNAQIVPNNSAVAFWTEGDKIKTGRGASPRRPPETTWNQSGPTEILKIEDTHIFNPNLYMTALWSDVSGGFALTPQGGLDVDMYYDSTGTAHNSHYLYETIRPQEQGRLDGSMFFDTAGIDHELRWGFGYRDTPVSSKLAYPGSGNYGYFIDETGGYAYLWRDGTPAYDLEQRDIYLGDTLLIGDLTMQVGVRYQQSTGINVPSTSRANPTVPELLPGIAFAGDDRELEWTSVLPRIGATYAFGDERRSVVRFAYNQYADTVGSGVIEPAGAVPLAQFLLYTWEDQNSDTIVGEDELGSLVYAYNVNVQNPASVESLTRIDYDMDPTTYEEFLVGYDFQIMPEFVIGANYSHRTAKDFAWRVYEKTPGAGDFYQPSDFTVRGNVTGVLPDGTTYTTPYYGLAEGSRSPYGVITNRPDFEQVYDGIELTATKRLSNRWMARGSFAWNEWTQSQGAGSYTDPTTLLGGLGCVGSNCDGEIVAEQSLGSGSKGNVWMSSGWSYNLTAFYELPFGVNVSGVLQGREGYPLPFVHAVNAGDGFGRKSVLVEGMEPHRMEDIFNVDLRLAKEFRFNDFGLTIGADVFNLTNETPVLQRDRIMATAGNQIGGEGNGGAFQILELQSPRVIRLGAQFSF